jgi:hypothetical protein
MKMIIFALLALVAVLVLLLLRKYTRLEFVGHARLLLENMVCPPGCCRRWLAYGRSHFPDAALHAWAMLPPDIKDILPPNIVAMISPRWWCSPCSLNTSDSQS